MTLPLPSRMLIFVVGVRFFQSDTGQTPHPAFVKITYIVAVNGN